MGVKFYSIFWDILLRVMKNLARKKYWQFVSFQYVRKTLLISR